MPRKDNRSMPRVPVKKEVTLNNGSFKVRNLSVSGCSFVSTQKLKGDYAYDTVLSIGGHRIKVKLHIVHRKNGKYGAEFIFAAKKERSILEKFILQYREL